MPDGSDQRPTGLYDAELVALERAIGRLDDVEDRIREGWKALRGVKTTRSKPWLHKYMSPAWIDILAKNIRYISGLYWMLFLLLGVINIITTNYIQSTILETIGVLIFIFVILISPLAISVSRLVTYYKCIEHLLPPQIALIQEWETLRLDSSYNFPHFPSVERRHRRLVQEANELIYALKQATGEL